MLLNGQHENGEDQLGCEKHLNEEALGCAGPATQAVGNGQRPGQKGGDDTGGTHTGKDLSGHDEQGAGDGETAADDESKSDLRERPSCKHTALLWIEPSTRGDLPQG